MSLRFPNLPGLRRARAASAVLLAGLALSGCLYRFTGGGLPSNLRTVYVELFENTTPYDILRTEVQRQLQAELPRSLGLRLAPQATADALIRGKLTSYDESTINFDPNASSGGRITANQRRVQITFDAEIYSVKDDKVIWQQSGISAVGNYNPAGESVDVGRDRAIKQIIQKLLEGAQSQW